MLIDLTQVYRNADDSPAVTADTSQPVTLRFMLIQALLSETDAEGKAIGPAEKLTRYSIYRDIKKAGDLLDIPAEDIVVLKNASKIFGTLVLGQTHEMLERSMPLAPL